MRRLPSRQVDYSAIPDGPVEVAAGVLVAGTGGGGSGDVLLIDQGAPVPTATPVGVVIFEKAVAGSGAELVNALLLDNGASVPATTLAGTVVFEKG